MKPDNRRFEVENAGEAVCRMQKEIDEATRMLREQDPTLTQEMFASELCRECAAIIRTMRWHRA